MLHHQECTEQTATYSQISFTRIKAFQLKDTLVIVDRDNFTSSVYNERLAGYDYATIILSCHLTVSAYFQWFQ